MKTTNSHEPTTITNRSYRSALLAILFLGIFGTLTIRCRAADIDDLIERDSLERIATGFRFTEGPLWHPDGYLFFTDIPASTIYKWTPDGAVQIVREPSGHSNGLTFDRERRLIACEHSNRQISRTEPDGTVVSLASEYDGSRLNSPNDAVVKSDGSIYFTDPPIGLRAEYGIPGTQELPFQGVFRLSRDGETLELLERGIFQPNGLTFSPDESVLYVADSSNSTIYAFDVQTDGLLENKRVFKTVSGWPDGMKVDVGGNLYVTTNTPSLQVYSSSGREIGSITIGARTTNCTFGSADNRTLFVTSGTSVYRMHMKVQGARPTADFSRPLWPPDFNGDSKVDIDDLVRLIESWGQDQFQLDIAPVPTGDGTVDVKDLETFMQFWGQDVNDPTLAAHWTLDESEGMFVSDSAGDKVAYAIGTPSWQPEGGKIGGALEFDGVDDFISAPAPLEPGEGSFSVLAWVKGGNPGQAIISEPRGSDWLSLDPATGNLMTELTTAGRGAAHLQSQVVIADGNWHRIGFIWDGLYRTLYVDGVAVAEYAQDSLSNRGSGFYIGTGKNMAAGTYFSGTIDDVRVYDRAVKP
ncbi:MAG: SMP-30/gluconolactonase/LRE family protein [Planctomycetota bacterium]|jgi:gluconolactonase